MPPPVAARNKPIFPTIIPCSIFSLPDRYIEVPTVPTFGAWLRRGIRFLVGVN